MKFDKKNLLILFLVVITILVVIISNIKKEDNPEIKIVKDYNDFYTVSSCLSRYNSYVNSKDSESVLLLLNNKYKSKNKITKSNVFENLKTVDNSDFVPKKMYYQEYNNMEKYYVYGELVVEDFEGVASRDGVYYIVYLYTKDKTYSIEPYDGSIFLGGVNNE